MVAARLMGEDWRRHSRDLLRPAGAVSNRRHGAITELPPSRQGVAFHRQVTCWSSGTHAGRPKSLGHVRPVVSAFGRTGHRADIAE
jgi:hypothetical protein